MFFDQNAGSGHLIKTSSGLVTISEWLGITVFNKTGSTIVNAHTFVPNTDRVENANIRGAGFMDLEGGPTNTFHAVYGRNGNYELYTNSGTASYFRSLPNASRPAGFPPAAARTKIGVSILTSNGMLYDAAHVDQPVTTRSSTFIGFELAGNKFTKYVTSDNVIPHSIRDVAFQHINASGVASGSIMPVNAPPAHPRCVDYLTPLGPTTCYTFSKTSRKAPNCEPHTNGNGALVGNRYNYGSIYTERAWKTAAEQKCEDPDNPGTYIDCWIDDVQKIIISDYSVPFSINCGGGGGRCFVAGTKIEMSDGTTIPIEYVKVGDKVRAFNEKTQKFEEGEVTELFIHDDSEGYIVLNGKVKATPEHPFLAVKRDPFSRVAISNNFSFTTEDVKPSDGHWYELGELAVGDIIFDREGNPTLIKSLKEVKEKGTVYNIEVEPQHTYIAEKLLVHNKALLVQAARDCGGQPCGGQDGDY